MDSHPNQELIAELVAARGRAEIHLRSLISAQTECERHLEESNRKDPMKIVTGRSSLENAVLAAKRIIESFDRQVKEATEAAARESGQGPTTRVLVGQARATLA